VTNDAYERAHIPGAVRTGGAMEPGIDALTEARMLT